MLKDLLAQETHVQVSVYFSGVDIGMSEHGLYEAQIGTAFQHVCGKGVAERMGADGFGNARSLGKNAQIMKHRNARKVLPPFLADENVVFLSLFRFYFLTRFKPAFQFGDGLFRNGHKALFGPFACHAYVAVGKKQVR